MSEATLALETLVHEIIAAKSCSSSRERATYNRSFAKLMKMLAPRIRHFTRQYGLTGFWEDAEQVAAIAVHRAIESYDPAKAQFTTFVNWQIRGEMQGLRFRLMTDQRSSAVKVNATTVSLQSLARNSDGEAVDFADTIRDEDALERVESGASDYLAQRAMEKLTSEYIRNQRQQAIRQLQRSHRKSKSAPAVNRDGARLRINTIDPAELEKLEEQLACKRDVIKERMFDLAAPAHHVAGGEMTRERMRQVSRHAARVMADIVASSEDFRIMREYRQPCGAVVCAEVARVSAAEGAPIAQMATIAPASARPSGPRSSGTRPIANVFSLATDRPLAVMPASVASIVARAASASGQTMVTTLLAA